MLVDGLPAYFYEPLLFLLTRTVSEEDQLVSDRIEAIRSEIAARGDEEVLIYSSPSPGSAGTLDSHEVRPPYGPVKPCSFEWIATVSSVSRYWGMFLYLVASGCQARTVLELGGCVGISGCYMAANRFCERFVTIEGSPVLAALAEKSLARVASNYCVVNALFDDGLDRVLPTLNHGLDLVYIDGQHEKIAALHYFETLVPYLNQECVVVFDDIHWSVDMWEAWQIICRREGLALSINMGQCGVCAWRGATTQVKNYDFSRFADSWGKGNVQYVP
jgi:hypothetical protein